MKEKDKYHIVAEAVRIEHEKATDTFYLVFEITDEKFRNRIKNDWTQDIDLVVIDRKLAEFKDEPGE